MPVYYFYPLLGWRDPGCRHVSNVAEYIGHLASGCKRLVWLSTTSTCNMAQYAQTNLRIIRMNVLVQEMIVDTFPDVAVIG